MKFPCQCVRGDHEACPEPLDCICALHDAPDAQDRAEDHADDADEGPRRALDEYDEGREG